MSTQRAAGSASNGLSSSEAGSKANLMDPLRPSRVVEAYESFSSRRSGTRKSAVQPVQQMGRGQVDKVEKPEDLSHPRPRSGRRRDCGPNRRLHADTLPRIPSSCVQFRGNARTWVGLCCAEADVKARESRSCLE